MQLRDFVIYYNMSILLTHPVAAREENGKCPLVYMLCGQGHRVCSKLLLFATQVLCSVVQTLWQEDIR